MPMSKALRYMVVDSETATLPLCVEIARNAEEKKKRQKEQKSGFFMCFLCFFVRK